MNNVGDYLPILRQETHAEETAAADHYSGQTLFLQEFLESPLDRPVYNSAGQHFDLEQVKGFGEKHKGVSFDAFLHAGGDNASRHHDHFCPRG